MTWRLLETGYADAFRNMALDEVILAERAEGRVPPTLRLYGWKPPAVSIGYFQRVKDEVNLERCKELGIDVVRRITGGGAVFHNMEVTYSVVASETEDSIPTNIQDSYERLCLGIVEGLRLAGVAAKFSPLNDVVVGSKKISGNAQTRRRGALLQHGTVLLDVDYETMFTVLKVGDEKLKKRAISRARERVTSLRELAPASCDFEFVSGCLIKGFSKALGVELSREEPTQEELAMTDSLSRTKYSTKEWNDRR